MRAILTNFGTTGDVYPQIALAVELQRHGHSPTLALSPYFAEEVERFGLDFYPLGPDLEEVQRNINNAMIATPEIVDSVARMHTLFSQLMSALPEMFHQLRLICAKADVLICGSMQPAGRMIHELTGIPFVSVQVEHFGGGGTPAFQEVSQSLINPFRAQMRLRPLSNPFTQDANSPQLAIYAMSRHVFSPPANWPAHNHITGFFFLDEEWRQPDKGLIEFLEAGEPPVALTFGSMTHEDPQLLTDLILDAVGRVGCRALIHRGWSGLGKRVMPPNVYPIGYVPYAWLFPRAACVVHHGGPGTAGAVFRAGVPHIFVPHAWDQPIWAKLTEELNCAGPTIPYIELSSEKLEASLFATLTTPRYYQAAAALGEKVRVEQGVQKARQLIEQLVNKIGLADI